MDKRRMTAEHLDRYRDKVLTGEMTEDEYLRRVVGMPEHRMDEARRMLAMQRPTFH